MTAKEYLNQARHLTHLSTAACVRLTTGGIYRAASQAVILNRTTIQTSRQKSLLSDALRKSTPFRGMWQKKSHTLYGSREKSTQPSMHLKCGMSSWYFAIGTLTTVLGRRFPGC